MPVTVPPLRPDAAAPGEAVRLGVAVGVGETLRDAEGDGVAVIELEGEGAIPLCRQKPVMPSTQSGPKVVTVVPRGEPVQPEPA